MQVLGSDQQSSLMRERLFEFSALEIETKPNTILGSDQQSSLMSKSSAPAQGTGNRNQTKDQAKFSEVIDSQV